MGCKVNFILAYSNKDKVYSYFAKDYKRRSCLLYGRRKSGIIIIMSGIRNPLKKKKTPKAMLATIATSAQRKPQGTCNCQPAVENALKGSYVAYDEQEVPVPVYVRFDGPHLFNNSPSEDTCLDGLSMIQSVWIHLKRGDWVRASFSGLLFALDRPGGRLIITHHVTEGWWCSETRHPKIPKRGEPAEFFIVLDK